MSPAPSLAEVLVSIRFNPDQVLGGLISACQQGYDMAGRVIVQALLPKLILMSRAYPYPGVDHLLSALWLRIMRYPLERRPRSVAANLVLDAKKDVVAEARMLLAPPLEAYDEDYSAHSVLALARRFGLATEKSLQIMEKVYLEGWPSARVAQVFAISPAAVRRRCSDTISRLKANRHLFTDYAQAA